MSDEALSRALFLNTFGDHARRGRVRDAMAESFNPETTALARLFAGLSVVIRRRVPVEPAVRYKGAIEATDVTCWIEMMPVKDDANGHRCLDRRQAERREEAARRPRTEAIGADRRAGDRHRSEEGGG